MLPLTERKFTKNHHLKAIERPNLLTCHFKASEEADRIKKLFNNAYSPPEYANQEIHMAVLPTS